MQGMRRSWSLEPSRISKMAPQSCAHQAGDCCSEPQSGLDTFNCRSTCDKPLPCTLNPAPFYPLPYIPGTANFRQGWAAQIPAIGDAICKQLRAFEFT